MGKNINKKWVILPVEVQAREGLSRFLIALEAASKGFGVIYGAKNEISKHLELLPPGIYLEKDISNFKTEKFRKWIEKGIKITSLDEEGLSSYNNPWLYKQQRISEETLNLVERVYTWGNYERNFILENFPVFKNKIIASGNPRVDIWSRTDLHKVYQQRVKGLVNTYGDYLFCSSNFGIMHRDVNDDPVERLTKLGVIKDKKDKDIYLRKRELKKTLLDSFVEGIKKVSREISNVTLIVRPHPSERIEWWQNEFVDFENVVITRDFTVTPWILGSKALIHSSCSTGLEAALMGIPALNFTPIKDPVLFRHLSDQVSHTIVDHESLISMAKQAINGDLDKSSSVKNEMREFLASMEDTRAYERIVADMGEIELEKAKFDTSTFKTTGLNHKIKSIVKKMAAAKVENPNNKIPGIKLKELKNTKDLLSISGFEMVKIKELSTNLFLIESK